MTDIVVSVASKVAECLVAPVGRHCCYAISSDSYVRQLIDEVEKLGDARDEVQHSIDEARNNMKLIKAKVERWVKEVETVDNKVRDLLDYDGRAKKTCFCGWLPNPKARHRLGKEASKMIKDIQALIARGQFEKVDFENPPPGLVGRAPNGNLSAADEGDTITDSRASIFQGIMKALDDEKLKVIGVYGPGGVGKTTLLEEVEKQLRKEGSPFHMIAKAKVSQTPDLKKIQDDIAYAFRLNLKDEPSDEGRRDRLFRKIQSDPSKKVLVILDDLWDKLDLKAVGIPSGDESTGCKLLLSSRFKDVLDKKMHADPTFLLEGLSNDEAFRLFEKTVGNRLKDEEELKPIADQVVKKLAGLPLLIISVASTLKYSDAPAWRNALIKIEESNVEAIVKLAYDHLKNEDAKYLFLLCGLISGTIEVEILLVLGMGLGLFEGFNKTMEAARDRLDNMLSELRSACLLLDGGEDKKNVVVIHDLYSEVVVSTTFRDQNSSIMNNNSWSEEKLEKCWAICLMDVGSDRLAERMRHGFPDLKVLMLSQPRGWWGRPAHRHVEDCCRVDFTSMKQLRVLYISSMNIPTLPSSINILDNLRSLYLDQCDVEDVAILGKLKALQILSFAGSTISRLPKEIGELINLKSLNLSSCDQLEMIEPGVLEGLINLEELYMRESFDRWMGKDEIPSDSCNARLVELKSLTKLTALEITIRDPTVLLEAGDLPFGNLNRFWISTGDVDARDFEGLRTMMLSLKGRDSVLSKEWVQKTLHRTQYLHLEALGESKENARMSCSAHKLCTQGFPQLRHLDIENSPSIEYIASSSGGIPLTAFARLESLLLRNLANLEEICHGPAAQECLSKLKDVEIRECNRLKYLWCLSQTQRFAHLEEINVSDCKSMRAIVTAVDDIIELPNVRHMYLSRLPRMTSFCIGAGIALEGAPIQTVYFTNECENDTLMNERISIIHDGKLQGLSVFPNVKKVYVKWTGLAFLFSLSMAKCLREIRDITVAYCQNMETVIMDEEGRDGGIYDIVEFSKLKQLYILQCPTEKFFSSPSGKKELVTTTSDSHDAYSDSLFDRKVGLPSLEVLMLWSAASLRRIWHGELPRSSFGELATLTLDDCSELLNVFPSTIMGRLHNLKWVKVSNCPSLESLFDCGSLDSSTDQEIVLLPKLEVLVVDRAEKLRHVVKSDSQMVLDFPRQTNVNCEQMKEAVPKEEGSRSKGVVMSFPSLTHITIRRCRNFEAFNASPTSVDWKLDKTAEGNDESPQSLFNETVKLPKITSLRIGGAQFKELWNDEIRGDSFCKLEHLVLEHCNNLQPIAPSYMWKRLQHCLEILEVSSCRSIKIVYEGDGIDTKNGKLRRLVLRDLENLRHVWQSDGLPNIPFPSLRSIEVQNCPSLKILFPTFIPEFLGQIKELVVKSCEDMELIAGHEECEEATGTAIAFSELIVLGLWELPKFRSFLPEKYSVEFPSLQVLSRVSCGTERDRWLGDWLSYQLRGVYDIKRDMWLYR